MHSIFTILVPYNVTIPTPASQNVGEQLTLQCDVITFEGILSSVDMIWSSDGVVLDRINNTNSTIINDRVVYSTSYTILQLNTSYHGRRIQCETLINLFDGTLLRNNVTIELNVTGKYMYSSVVAEPEPAYFEWSDLETW